MWGQFLQAAPSSQEQGAQEGSVSCPVPPEGVTQGWATPVPQCHQPSARWARGATDPAPSSALPDFGAILRLLCLSHECHPGGYF